MLLALPAALVKTVLTTKKVKTTGAKSPMLYSRHSSRPAAPGADGLEGDRAPMTATFFWKLFAQTGSIDAYLAYRHLHPVPSPT